MNKSIKYILVIVLMAVMPSCAKEVLEPEQMISGDYALDDGSQVSDTYLHFENGYVIKMVASSDKTFAENYFWDCQSSDFRSWKSSKYSIQNGELSAFGRNMGPISQKGDALTLDGDTYYVLKGYKTECYSRIAIEKQTLDFLPQTATAEVTIEHPIKSGILTASTKTGWISDVKIVGNKTLSYSVSDTNVDRQGTITLSYTNAQSYDVIISQEPKTHILLPSSSGNSLSYSKQPASFEYSIDNPVPTSSLSVICNASWISGIMVTDNVVNFEVAENASSSNRNAIFTLRYAGARDVTYTLTQNWASTSITTAPQTKEFTYTGGNGSFTFSIENPRDGASTTATTSDSWITGISVSGNIVSYKVSERLSSLPRNGKISLKYSKSSTIFATKDFTVNQTGMPVTALSLNRTNIALTAGQTETLVASVTPSDAELKWSSNHPEYAKVDASGRVTAVDAGTAIITVSAGDRAASCSVMVSDRENKLSLTTSWTESTGLTYGNTGTITISNPSGGALSISSKPSSSIATASLSGNKVTITPVSAGETSIKIKSAKTTGYVEVVKTVTIKVLKATPAMTLSATSLSINLGGETASVSVTTNSDGALSASSSNTSVASVSVSGKTVSVKSKDIEGNATITVICAESGQYKGISKEVAVKVIDPYLVDLGLSVKWRSCNLGTSKPAAYGGYYQWAGTKDVTDKSIYLDWSSCPYHTGSSSSTGWTKYVPSGKSSYWSGSGSPDNKTVLDPEDDVAHVKLGGKWRMPTYEEWEELRNNCTSEWTILNGVTGRKFTSKKNGNSIFLPAAGGRYNDYLYGSRSYGYYWSSSLRTVFPYDAYELYFSSGDVDMSYGNRYDGNPVRPVSD